MAGFRLRGSLAEGGATIQPMIAGAAVVVGDLVMLSAGKVIPLTTDSEGAVGVVVSIYDKETAVVDTDPVLVSTDASAVFGVDDATARVLGATLDVAGASGAMTVAASSNKDLVVAAKSTALQETLVRHNLAKHFTITNDLT